MRTNIQLPRVFKFKGALRWFTIILALLACVWAVYLIYQVKTMQGETTMFTRILPYLILFFAANSLLKNTFTLNRVKLYQDRIVFSSLLGSSTVIPWAAMRQFQFQATGKRSIKIYYQLDGKDKLYLLSIAFPNMLEIINLIVALAPQAERDEFVDNVVIPGYGAKPNAPEEIDTEQINA